MKFLTVVAAFVGVAMAAPPIAIRDGSDNTVVQPFIVKIQGDPGSKPLAADIWGSNGGPFENRDNGLHLAAVARILICTTFFLPGGNEQPSVPASSYYAADPTDRYSRLIHEHEVDGRGFGFPYDNVNAGNEKVSKTVSSGRPKTLTVYVGGYSA
ncbi:hypothetical protein MY10362_009605 [Beauveria mimosiformis]